MLYWSNPTYTDTYIESKTTFIRRLVRMSDIVIMASTIGLIMK